MHLRIINLSLPTLDIKFLQVAIALHNTTRAPRRSPLRDHRLLWAVNSNLVHLLLQIEYLHLGVLGASFAGIFVVTNTRLPMLLIIDRRLLLLNHRINVHLDHKFFRGLLLLKCRHTRFLIYQNTLATVLRLRTFVI